MNKNWIINRLPSFQIYYNIHNISYAAIGGGSDSGKRTDTKHNHEECNDVNTKQHRGMSAEAGCRVVVVHLRREYFTDIESIWLEK